MFRLTTLAGAATALWAFAAWIGAARTEPTPRPAPAYAAASIAAAPALPRARINPLKPAVRRLAPGVMARS